MTLLWVELDTKHPAVFKCRSEVIPITCNSCDILRLVTFDVGGMNKIEAVIFGFLIKEL
jgi:hypothetical protein